MSRSRSTLIALNYDVIAERAGGITGDTARQYAQQGHFDSRNLESVLCWVNSRRGAKGMPLIGLPIDTSDDYSDDYSDDAAEVVISVPAPTGFGSPLVYDPLIGSYRYDT